MIGMIMEVETVICLINTTARVARKRLRWDLMTQ